MKSKVDFYTIGCTIIPDDVKTDNQFCEWFGSNTLFMEHHYFLSKDGFKKYGGKARTPIKYKTKEGVLKRAKQLMKTGLYDEICIHEEHVGGGGRMPFSLLSDRYKSFLDHPFEINALENENV